MKYEGISKASAPAGVTEVWRCETLRISARRNYMRHERYIYPNRVLDITEKNGILTFKFIKKNETDINDETRADDIDEGC